jgi:hypothetical protein
MPTIGIALEMDQDYRDGISESTHTAWKNRKVMMAQTLACQRPRKMTGSLGELVVAILHLLIKGSDSQGLTQ